MGYVVLFGAGASFGSGSVSPYPPPLGDQLFNKLDELGKTAASLPESLKEKFRNNFEEGMMDFYSWSNKNTMSFQRELAGYLAKFEPKNDNNYIRLIKKIKTSRFTFVSLNYDLLFELASLCVGYGINYSNKKKKGYIQLLKIHGSSNFWPDTGFSIFENVHFSGNAGADIGGPVKILDQKGTLDMVHKNDSLAPAIAMYAEGKSVRVCPDFVKNQQAMWNESINSASKIFIVGVRVNESDEHIWKTIAESNAAIFYFGFPSDEEEFNKWKEFYNLKNAYFRLSDFTNAVEALCNLSR